MKKKCGTRSQVNAFLTFFYGPSKCHKTLSLNQGIRASGYPAKIGTVDADLLLWKVETCNLITACTRSGDNGHIVR